MAKKKILVIDFDNEFVKFLSRVLTEEGYEVITAADGLAGFEKFSEIHPDLVIMEAMLPKFHGFELCSRITSHPTKKSPVIIITGIYKDAVYKTEALKSLGASAYFEKPLKLEELKSKIYELIGKPEIKKNIPHPDQDFDQLLKEALQVSSISNKKQTATTAKKEVSQKISSPSKDDEIDLILKSKLKDIISDNSASEQRRTKPSTLKEEKVITSQVQPSAAKKPEPVSKSTQPEVSQENKPVETISPSIPKKIETAVSESKSELKKEIRGEQKAEQKVSLSFSGEPEKPKASATSMANPFKGYISENKEEESKKKSSRLFIGIAAAVLIVIAAVALFSLKKKESPAFNNRNSNQAAALQTSSGEQPKDQNSGQQPNTEEDLNKEIENQIATYRQQKAQSAVNNSSPAGKNQNLPGKTVNKIESAPVAVAPVLPKETPKLAENLNTNQSMTATNQENTATPVDNTQNSKLEATAPANQAKTEEQPVAIPSQKVKTGDLLPLSMVDIEPKVIKTVEPVYPEADRRLGIKGNVILNVLISENGDVLEAVVIRSIKGSVGLEKEAINAVKKWKFLPAEKDGVKVRTWKPITIGFGITK